MIRPALSALLLLAACSGPKSLYLFDQSAPQDEIAVRARLIEVKEVVLPAYAAASDVAVQTPDGALTTVRGALWAEDPVDAVTRLLARSLDLGTTATAAAEPWPLIDSPDLAMSVRIDRMLARADGRFELSGQYAAAFAGAGGRDFLRRFEILEPMAGSDPAAVGAATGRALDRLSREIATALRR
jgi:hypothetical protein